MKRSSILLVFRDTKTKTKMYKIQFSEVYRKIETSFNPVAMQMYTNFLEDSWAI